MIHIGAPQKIKRFLLNSYNADGGKRNMCLNGIRCAASYIWDKSLHQIKTLIFKPKTIDIRCNLLKKC